MKKRFLLTSALMLLLTVLALTSATYAWFTMSTTNRVNDFTMTAASADGGLEISIDGQVFSNTEVTIANPTLSALDITTKDGKTFYKATEVDPVTGAVDVVDSAGVVKNQSYFEYDLYFRTSVAGDIKLDLGRSYIVPASLKSKLNTTGNPYTFEFAAKDANSTNQSALGEFTRDWIAAATRISFEVTGYQYGSSTVAVAPTDAEDTSTAKLQPLTQMKGICEPFATSAGLVQNTVANTWSMTDAKVAQSVQGLAEIASTDSATDRSLSGAGYTTYKLLDGNDDLVLFTIDNTNFYNGATAVLKVTLRVWIEGQDDEAKAALALGQFTTGLTFYQTPSAIADTIKLTYNNGSKVLGTQYVADAYVAAEVADANAFAAGTFYTEDGGEYTLATEYAANTDYYEFVPAHNEDVVTGLRWAAKSDAIASIQIYDGDNLVATYEDNTTTYAFDAPKTAAEVANYKLRINCEDTISINGKALAVEIFVNNAWVKVSTLTNKYFEVAFN